MRAAHITQVLLGAGIALGVAAGGCYGDYGGTTSSGSGTTGSTTEGGTGTSSADGGGTGSTSGGPETTNNNFGTASVCTSMKNWTNGDNGRTAMYPGQACNACHAPQNDPPIFFAAGTVYPTANEPDSCLGQSGVTVIITDKNGQKATLTTNASGNFACDQQCAGFATPYTAELVYKGLHRHMSAAQTNGDCNSCHGAPPSMNAPGRLMTP
jgi:hypothetical protein